MVLDIRVIPKAGRSLVKEEPDGSFKVYLTKPAIEGKANEELVKLLAEYFKVKRYLISIIKGKKGRNKVVRIAQCA
jgi:hypothetical protein